MILSGCSDESWEGYVYPDKGDGMIRINAGTFHNLEACKEASLAMLESKDALQKGYYKCAKNCTSGSNHYDTKCEEILRFNFYK
jgi:hypothetical protein